MTALIVAMLIAAPPPLDCSLLVNGQNTLGGRTVVNNEVTGHGMSREQYRLEYGASQVRARLIEPAPLFSLTWQPSRGTRATFTCTSKVVEPREDRRAAAIAVACLSDTGAFTIGLNQVQLQIGALRLSASATGYEFRVEAHSPVHGSVIAWSDHRTTGGNGTQLRVGPRNLTCWRM